LNKNIAQQYEVLTRKFEKSAAIVSIQPLPPRRVIEGGDAAAETENPMRYMIIVKGTPADEQAMPDPAMFEEMGRFNQSLADAGILLAAEGLAPSKEGAIVAFDKGKTSVQDGPFTEAKEMIGGFWIIQAKSLDEALTWAGRIPFQGGEVEVRRVAETSDFEGTMSPEAMAQEESLREQLSGKNN
jgi:hypothetical protein